MKFNDKQFSVYNGNKLKIEIFGASHAEEIGVKVVGLDGKSADFEKLKGKENRKQGADKTEHGK